MIHVTNEIGTMKIKDAARTHCVIQLNAGCKLFDEKIGPAMDKKFHKER